MFGFIFSNNLQSSFLGLFFGIFLGIFPLILIGLFINLPIGNSAHLGGLVVGIVYGIYLKRKYPKKTKSISRHFS